MQSPEKSSPDLESVTIPGFFIFSILLESELFCYACETPIYFNFHNFHFFSGFYQQPGKSHGLIAAQDCLPDNNTLDEFAAEYSVLSRLWEALSPDHAHEAYEADSKWLTQVYESVKPPSGNGKLLWHALEAKTIELVPGECASANAS